MSDMSINDYKLELVKLSVNKKSNMIAPHKAIMLLTVIDLIETGDIDSPFVPLSGTVDKRFKALWEKYVKADGHFSCKMNYPFFHLSSSSFWKLQKLSTYEDRVEYSSLTMLKRSFAGALLNQDLFELLSDNETRAELKQILIATYLQPCSPNAKKITGSLLSLVLAVLCVA